MQDIYRLPIDGYHPHLTNPDQDPQGIPYEICRWPDITTLYASLEQQVRDSGINFALKLPHDSIWVTRYIGIGKTGRLKLEQKPQMPLAGKLVLGIEDIVDKRDSAEFLHRYFAKRGVKHFALATLPPKTPDYNLG